MSGSDDAAAPPAQLLTGSRVAAAGLLLLAGLGLWQSMGLERWSIEGPGPGLFPVMVALVFALLALVVLIWPGRAAATEEGDTDRIDPETRARTRSSFAIYALSMVVLAAGAAFMGFTVTSIAVSVLIVRFAEGRSWFAAIAYGLGCAAVGLVGFGWLLRVDLPSSFIEHAFFSLVR